MPIGCLPCGRRNNGRPVFYDREELLQEIRTLPVTQRTSVRDIASNVGVAPCTVARIIRDENLIVRHENNIKPALTKENQFARVEYCLDKRDWATGLATYIPFTNICFLDEKWFYISQVSMKTYLCVGEEPPYWTCKHKSHLQKLMVMCVLTRSQYVLETDLWFDGKIACIPIAERVQAKRASKNRQRGTYELKSKTLNKALYKHYLKEKVIPAILEKWPRKMQPDGSFEEETVWLQQDNAPAHVSVPEFVEIMSEFRTDGLFIRLGYQPPNSPDLNILDLCLF